MGFFSRDDSDLRKTLDDVVKALNRNINLLNEVGGKVADLRAEFTALTARVISLEKRPRTVEDSRAPVRRRVPKDAVRVDQLPIGDETHVDLGDGGDCGYGVVGESHRQGALRDLAGARLAHEESVRFVVKLVLEPDNPVDPNAIKVCASEGGAQLAYIPRGDAVTYRPILEALARKGYVGLCRAKLIGGAPGKPSIGVQLDLSAPADLASRMGGGEPF
jgi:hypothetical protein